VCSSPGGGAHWTVGPSGFFPTIWNGCRFFCWFTSRLCFGLLLISVYSFEGCLVTLVLLCVVVAALAHLYRSCRRRAQTRARGEIPTTTSIERYRSAGRVIRRTTRICMRSTPSARRTWSRRDREDKCAKVSNTLASFVQILLPRRQLVTPSISSSPYSP
jgi:hypothetical protein